MIFRRYPLDEHEIAALQDAVHGDKERLVVTVLLSTGLRVSEFASLSSRNLYEDRGLIVLEGAKGRRPRHVPLTVGCAALLRQWFASHGGRVGYSTSWWRRIVKRVAARAGVQRICTPHVLRHTFAVQSLRAGRTIRAVQLVLGHSSLQVTEGYLAWTEEQAAGEFMRSAVPLDTAEELCYNSNSKS